MRFIFSYIWQRRRGIFLFFLFCAIFAGSFLLYHLPVAAVFYPALLCGLIGLLYLTADFHRVRQRYGRLQRLCGELDVYRNDLALLWELPNGETLEDNGYRQLISLLVEAGRNQEDAYRARAQDMVDYYTAWVHQIKTPIASMRLKLQNEDTEFSRTLSGDLFRIEQYVEMVLCYLRLDSQSTDYVFREYDLDGIVRQAVKKYAGEFISRKISLRYEPLCATVLTDEKWLLFVLEQVLSNALKYTQEGSVTISLEVPKTLCVCDTGIGIAPEDLPRIFEKGYTGCNGRADKRASGLGLYLSQRICKNLGHTLAAESEVGAGTVIRIGLQERKTRVE